MNYGIENLKAGTYMRSIKVPGCATALLAGEIDRFYAELCARYYSWSVLSVNIVPGPEDHMDRCSLTAYLTIRINNTKKPPEDRRKEKDAILLTPAVISTEG